MQLFVGTNNKGKVREISECLNDLQIQIITPSMIQLRIDDPEETGTSFEENALQKAKFYYEECVWPTVADDSGIIIHALQGELGVHTRRWGAGPDATDEEWIAYFLDRMKSEEDKRAMFVCNIAYFDEGGNVHTFEGRCEGTITDELQADYLPGLPISACFKPDGFDQVYSAMSIDEKNTISHRGKAMKKFRDQLSM